MMELAGTDVAALEEYRQWRTGKENDMVRERTMRATIDEMLLKAAHLAEGNDLVLLRLRASLLGTPAEEQRQERPSCPGWLGEIADSLEGMIEHLTDTATVLEEVSQQVALTIPVAPQGGSQAKATR